MRIAATMFTLAFCLIVGLGGCANRLPIDRDAGPTAAAPRGGCSVIRTVTVKPRPGVSRCQPAPCRPACPPVADRSVCAPRTVEMDCTSACVGGRCSVPR